MRKFHLQNPANYHPDNHREVYAERLAQRVNPRVVTGLHGLMGLAIVPIVSYGEGVEEKLIQWQQAAERPAESVMNHQSYIDHFVDAAAAHHSEALNFVSERGSPVGKVEYFDYQLGLAEGEKPSDIDVVISVLYRMLGTITAWREKDLQRVLGREDVKDYFTATNNAMIDTVVELMARKKIIHLYPEGTRKRGDWTTIGDEVFGGASRALVQAWNDPRGIQPALLVGARSYGVKEETHWSQTNWRRPHIHFGLFEEGPFTRKIATTKLIEKAMQDSLNAAHEQSEAYFAERDLEVVSDVDRIATAVRHVDEYRQRRKQRQVA